jgi:hypothetical protein
MESNYYPTFIVPAALTCRLFIKRLASYWAQQNVRTTVAETFKLELSNKWGGLNRPMRHWLEVYGPGFQTSKFYWSRFVVKRFVVIGTVT